MRRRLIRKGTGNASERHPCEMKFIKKSSKKTPLRHREIEWGEGSLAVSVDMGVSRVNWGARHPEQVPARASRPFPESSRDITEVHARRILSLNLV